MSKTTPESQESDSPDLQRGGILVLARSAPVFGEFLGRIKLGGIRRLPKLVGCLILLLLEQGDEVVERPLLAPIAEIEER